MSGISDFLLGSKDKIKQIATGTPQQQNFHSNILEQLKQSLGQGGGYNASNQYYNNLLQPDQQGFDQFSSPYLQQFEEQILPMIAERFGGMGALSSSGFAQALGGAGAGLQSKLAELFSNLQGQAAQQQYGQFNQMGQFGLNYRPFENVKKEGSGGMLGPLAIAAGTALGGPLGGALGGVVSGGISSLFKNNNSSGGGLGGLASNNAMLAGLMGR